ncbi:hypothetical protein GOODEAATRI_007523 [Goodea atripinnis]|uniref:Uncharacterized protein n=1 Tax=Goodea atripinnis TaxID=208336 RepID=A0ABV0P2A7_9TELE
MLMGRGANVLCNNHELLKVEIYGFSLVNVDDRLVIIVPFTVLVEYDKLANEKTEMQRHYVMVSLRYNEEQLWYQIARLVEDQVRVERRRLL